MWVNFLVCTNIGYNCVLGWDFLVHNNLDLQREMFRRTRSYRLVGSHGKLRVSAVGCTKSSNKSVSGVLEASPGTEKAPKCEAYDDFLLAQSNIKAPVFIALENNMIIQGRCEIIVPGRLVKSPTHESLNCHVANAVVRPLDGHSVPIRILNVLDKPVELCQGRKIAEFTPLVQSSSKQSSACCSIASQASPEFRERAAKMIDSSLGKEDTEKLLDVLSAYQDVLEDTLGDTNVVKHTINTGNNQPIRHCLHRLPYKYRAEEEHQIA